MNINNIKELNVECFGCEVCAYVCPKLCIIFTDTQNGFKYPVVDDTKCTQCSICYNKCPINATSPNSVFVQQYYAAISFEKDSLKSASGGLFYTIAKYVIERLDGIVYGCAFNENLSAKHMRIDNVAELIKLQGSKYVQSDTGGGCYEQLCHDLKNGKKVLFAGTPCQVAGVKQAFSEYRDFLITIDIICHGVPSPKLFSAYIRWLEEKKGKITNYTFRNHSYNLIQGYKARIEATRTTYVYAQDDPYYRAFINGETYRRSCYKCKYASVKREGDISLGDCNSIIYSNPLFSKCRAASLLIVNNIVGEQIINCIEDKLKIKNIDILQEMKYNTQLVHPSSFNEKRYNEIYKTLNENQEILFSDILTVKDYSLKQKLKALIKRTIPEILIRVFRYLIMFIKNDKKYIYYI